MTHIDKLFSNLSKHTIKTNIIGLVSKYIVLTFVFKSCTLQTNMEDIMN